MYNLDSSPTVANCTFSDNSATWSGGGMYNYPGIGSLARRWTVAPSRELGHHRRRRDVHNASSVAVTNCTFLGNSAISGGGMFNSYSWPEVTNCTFSNNWSEHSGGGMENYSGSSPTVTNCAFLGNSTDLGGGMSIHRRFLAYGHQLHLLWQLGRLGWRDVQPLESSPAVTNCTFSNNWATLGGAMHNHDSMPAVTNCILWEDRPDEISNVTSQPAVTHSDIQGGYDGAGNIDADPLFLDPGRVTSICGPALLASIWAATSRRTCPTMTSRAMTAFWMATATECHCRYGRGRGRRRWDLLPRLPANGAQGVLDSGQTWAGCILWGRVWRCAPAPSRKRPSAKAAFVEGLELPGRFS